MKPISVVWGFLNGVSLGRNWRKRHVVRMREGGRRRGKERSVDRERKEREGGIEGRDR